MRVTHLSAHDLDGGAARAAYRLHVGLRSLGIQSSMFTFYKKSSDPTVLQFDSRVGIVSRFRRGLKRRFLEREWSQLRKRPPGASLFTDDRSQYNADLLRQLPQADLLNLHWIAGILDYRLFFSTLSAELPVVWTLHDMNPFTGGCHFDGGCGKFGEKCGACPQLGSSDDSDPSFHIWSRKRSAFSSQAGKKLRLVAPSRWLACEARKSSLLGHYAVDIIPYGIDTSTFQPHERRAARAKLGIPTEAKVVLFVADSAAEKRKGLSILLEALRGLENSRELYFVAIGRGSANNGLGDRSKTIEFVGDEVSLSFVYSAADIFVIPSLQDNLPNTAIEALACGIPTVGANAGGIPEIVRDGATGLVVPAGDPKALVAAIKKLIDDDQSRTAMGRECRRVAVEEYSLGIQASRYAKLYKELMPGN